MYKIFTLLAVLTALGGCSMRHQVQTTSGQSYLQQYQEDTASNKPNGAKQKAVSLNSEIRKAALTEPILTFPARIGLARIENGRLTDIPEPEAADWQKFSKDHKQLGQFVSVNVLGTANAFDTPRGWRYRSLSDISVESIRLAAARQHLDAVLIYEINSRARKNNTVLAIADLTIVGGAILPTRSITAEGSARALLVDVRNGYPYGSASSSTEISKFSSSWGSDEREVKIQKQALNQAYEELSPRIETMFEELFTQMKTTKS
jgi:hypothetical protein